MPSPGTDRAHVTPAAAHAHGSVIALKHIGILNISRILHDFEARQELLASVSVWGAIY
jgi:hypothetical protein